MRFYILKGISQYFVKEVLRETWECLKMQLEDADRNNGAMRRGKKRVNTQIKAELSNF